MIIKQKNGTILEMTTKEFSELGHVLGSTVEAEAEVDVKTEVATDFKVGDKVEVIGKSVTGRDEFIGNTAVITFIDEIGDIQIVEGNGLNGWYRPSSLEIIKEETEEVLSYENVKIGELLVVTDKNNGSQFAIGGIIKAVAYYSSVAFTASNTDNTEHWNVRYTDVRRATDAEIAEATKPKEVKFEIGDMIKVGGSFAKVTSEIETDGDYFVKYLDNGENSCYKPSAMRHATEEERSHLQTLIGRKKDEYKVGDLARLETSGLRNSLRTHVGCIFEVGHINSTGAVHLSLGDNRNDTLAYTNPKYLKLITPVEWRHDFI